MSSLKAEALVRKFTKETCIFLISSIELYADNVKGILHVFENTIVVSGTIGGYKFDTNAIYFPPFFSLKTSLYLIIY
jgi:hypothetical protein